MISIINKANCTGCGGCASVCPTDAICIKEDEEGCRYPVVDSIKCIECQACVNKCPMTAKENGTSIKNADEEPEYYAAQLIDKKQLFAVSSGGAFWALTQAILNQGGIVYGVAQDAVDNIHHIRATNIEEALQMRRSKYLQSDVNDCYKLAKRDLEAGKKVLFSGTGCQIAALNMQLGNKYSNLYTCEVVCHGVPSSLIWRKYREEKETREKKTIQDLVFRDKSKGWSNNQYKIVYEDGSVEYTRSEMDLFHAGYLQGFFYRPSCGKCQFAHVPREADITLADFWSYDGKIRNLFGDKGISLVVVNNSRGKELFNFSCRFLHAEKVSEEKANKSCRHLNNSPKENPYRKEFISTVLKDGYYSAARQYIKFDSDSFKERFIRKTIQIVRNIRWRNPLSKKIHHM